MKILALSFNAPTPTFRAAVLALQFAGHRVEAFRSRAFGESNKFYNAALVSPGDVTAEDSLTIKLSAMRAITELPVCYLLDQPAEVRTHPPEAFWLSALYGESATAVLHRSEMHVAIRDGWQSKVERILELWASPDLPGIAPSDWDPRPFLLSADQRLADKTVLPQADSSRRLSASVINCVRSNKFPIQD